MSASPMFLTILLALYGWWLLTRLAKQREAHDLYTSVIALLYQLEIESIAAWQDNPSSLDEYTELNLVSKLADVEQRLDLIKKHYKSIEEFISVTEDEIQSLRKCMTQNQNAKSIPSGASRRADIHRIISTMRSKLLAENYEHINL